MESNGTYLPTLRSTARLRLNISKNASTTLENLTELFDAISKNDKALQKTVVVLVRNQANHEPFYLPSNHKGSSMPSKRRRSWRWVEASPLRLPSNNIDSVCMESALRLDHWQIEMKLKLRADSLERLPLSRLRWGPNAAARQTASRGFPRDDRDER